MTYQRILILFSFLALAKPTLSAFASWDDYRHIVSVRVQGHHICTGTSIGSRTIITAASCFLNKDLNLRKVTILMQGIFLRSSYTVRDISLHPEFNSDDPCTNDIALLYLYQPTELPLIPFLDDDRIRFGEALEFKRVVAMQVDDATKMIKLRHLKITDEQYDEKESEICYGNDKFCAKEVFAEDNEDWEFDAGGPIMSFDNKEFVGIAHYDPNRKCRTQEATTFTRTKNFANWMEETTKSKSWLNIDKYVSNLAHMIG